MTVSHANDAPVEVGTVLADKYRVERVLGSGGMGVVVAVRHLELGELCAIKYMLPSARGLEEAGVRFMREARAAARLKSEHAVRVYDVGRFASGEPFMVMEHLVGHDLKEELKQTGPLPVSHAVHYLLQTCEALAEAHSMGIIHRDLKPSNLFLTKSSDGRPWIKVLDFGISKLVGALAEWDSDLTQTAALLGTPAYMSPEQMAEARDIDARTDVWSLGVILYELLAAMKPFAGRSIPAITMAVASQSVPPLRARRPDVSIGLETVVLRCLMKDRQARYPDVESLARALAPFAADVGDAIVERIVRVQRISVPEAPMSRPSRPPSLEPPTRVLPTPALAPPQAPISHTAASWGSDARAPAARRHLPVIVVMATLAVAAVAVVAAWAVRDPAASEAPDEPAVETPSQSAPHPSAAPSPAPSAAPRASAAPIASSAPSTAPAARPPQPQAAPRKRDPFGENWR